LRARLGRRRREASGRFLKKAAPKIFVSWAMGVGPAQARGPAEQKFFARFFPKKRRLEPDDFGSNREAIRSKV
jgi:hypothetical protein